MPESDHKVLRERQKAFVAEHFKLRKLRRGQASSQDRALDESIRHRQRIMARVNAHMKAQDSPGFIGPKALKAIFEREACDEALR